MFHAWSNYSGVKWWFPTSPKQKTVRASVGILSLGAAIALLYYGRVFFITVIIASMIAFLLDPMVVLFMKLRLPRGVASFAVCSIGLLFLYLAGLGIYTESVVMLGDLPAYGERINELVDSASLRFEHFEQTIYKTMVPKRFQNGGQAAPEIRRPPAAARGKLAANRLRRRSRFNNRRSRKFVRVW